MARTSFETNSSIYLLQESVDPEDFSYSLSHLVGTSFDLPKAEFSQHDKVYKSEQDLLDDSEDITRGTRRGQESSFLCRNKISSNQEHDKNNNDRDGTPRKRWKSETELRTSLACHNINNKNSFVHDDRLMEVDNAFKSSRYFRTGDSFTEHSHFFTSKRLFSILVTFVSFTYAAFFLYLLTRTKNSYLLANSLHWVFPSLIKDHFKEVLEDIEVGHCELTMENVVKKTDIFLLGHVLGYAGKMILFRDFGFTWLISISWEFTEIFYSPILPNFIECWWDIVLFDICICNAAGILMGYLIIRALGINQLNWYEGEQHQHQHPSSSTSCHPHIQQSPQPPRWKPMLLQAWYVFILLFFCNMAELNSFTLKRVFGVNKNHPLNVIRLLIHAFMSYNVISGYRKVLRGVIRPSELPAQFWVYLLAIGLEFATVLRHGPLYTVNLLPNMACWISMLFVGTLLYVILATFANFIYYGASDCKTD